MPGQVKTDAGVFIPQHQMFRNLQQQFDEGKNSQNLMPAIITHNSFTLGGNQIYGANSINDVFAPPMMNRRQSSQRQTPQLVSFLSNSGTSQTPKPLATLINNLKQGIPSVSCFLYP